MNPVIGYEKAALIARESERTGKTIREILIEHDGFTKEEIDALFDPVRATSPQKY